MKISDLNFVSETPVTKTLKLGDVEYPIGVRQLSCGDHLQVAAATVPRNVALIAKAIVFEDGQQLTDEQATKLDVGTAAALLDLIQEVNAPKN